MSLLNLLSNSSNGLSAQRAVSQTAAHNIANVSTPGFSRQRVGLESGIATPNGGSMIGTGVKARGVQQARDQFVENQMPEAFGAAAYAEAESSVLKSVTQLAPELESGVPVSLGAFYGALRDLSENPASLGHRSAFLEAARGLTLSLKRAGDNIHETRESADVRLEAQLPVLNDMLQRVSDLNARIRIARAQSGGEPNDLLDQQRIAVDEVASLTGARVLRDGDGNANLVLPTGAALVTATEAARFEAEPDPANGGLLKVKLAAVGGGVSRELDARELGGEIGGLVGAREGALKRAADDLDAFAYELGNSINALHRAGFGLDGSTGNDLFDVGAQAGAARAITVNELVINDPERVAAAKTLTLGSGDNSNLMDMLATENQVLGPLSGPPRAILGDLIGRYGAVTKRAISTADAEAVARDFLVGLRESTAGVSVDEELIEITKAQRAFEAMGKVVDTTSKMLESLLNLR